MRGVSEVRGQNLDMLENRNTLLSPASALQQYCRKGIGSGGNTNSIKNKKRHIQSSNWAVFSELNQGIRKSHRNQYMAGNSDFEDEKLEQTFAGSQWTRQLSFLPLSERPVMDLTSESFYMSLHNYLAPLTEKAKSSRSRRSSCSSSQSPRMTGNNLGGFGNNLEPFKSSRRNAKFGTTLLTVDNVTNLNNSINCPSRGSSKRRSIQEKSLDSSNSGSTNRSSPGPNSDISPSQFK